MYVQDDFYRAAKLMPPEYQGRFLMALMEYANEGVEPEFGPDEWPIAAVFEVIRDRVDMSRARSEAGRNGGKSRKQAEGNAEASAKQNGSKSEAKRKQNESKTKANAKQTPSKSEANAKQTRTENKIEIEIENENIGGTPLYIPPQPTESEVRAYAKSFGHPDFDAQMFVAHYDGVGWRVRGQPIMDWRGVCRRWMLEDARKDEAGGNAGGYVVKEWDELAG